MNRYATSLKKVCYSHHLASLMFFATMFSAFEISLADEVRAPNIILIVTDDQGYSDVGFNGCKDIPTPNLDRIADEGVCCTNGYVSFSVCGPSRAGMMTGRYQGKFGFTTNPTIDPSNAASGIPLTETTLAEALKPAGYTNMIVGKWHLGTHPTLRPLKRGFDEFFGFLSGGHDYFTERYKLESLSDVTKQWGWYRTKLLENAKRVEVKGYLTDVLSDKAIQFVERSKNKPFFLYLAYNAPHTPLQATEKYLNRFAHIENEKRRKYAAMISAVDDGVGKLLDSLDENQLSNNTIIFFLADNGGATNNAANNKPLRGHKGSFFEGGLRVPFAICFPGKIPAGSKFEPMVSSLDIFPTVISLANGSLPDKPLDGVNLIPYLDGSEKGNPHDLLTWRHYKKDTFAIRKGYNKLITNHSNAPETLLFDLANDGGESQNLASEKNDHDARTMINDLNLHLKKFKSQLKEPAFPALGSWLNKKQADK